MNVMPRRKVGCAVVEVVDEAALILRNLASGGSGVKQTHHFIGGIRIDHRLLHAPGKGAAGRQQLGAYSVRRGVEKLLEPQDAGDVLGIHHRPAQIGQLLPLFAVRAGDDRLQRFDEVAVQCRFNVGDGNMQ